MWSWSVVPFRWYCARGHECGNIITQSGKCDVLFQTAVFFVEFQVDAIEHERLSRFRNATGNGIGHAMKSGFAEHNR